MKKRYHGGFPGSKMYLTEADPSCQRLFGMTKTQFDVTMKMWLLLSDHTILSTAHMLRSDITYSWLESNAKEVADLASNGSMLVSLRDDRDSITQYVLGNGRTTDQPSEMVARKRLLLNRAGLLSELFEQCITWSPMAESRWFQKCLWQLLRDKASPLRRRLVGVSNASISALLESVDTCSFLNRETWRLLVKKHCPQRSDLLTKFGDILYYLSGATHKNAYPVLNAGALELCKEKVGYAVERCTASATKSTDLWREIAGSWGLTWRELHRLPLRDIDQLRRDSTGRRVRKTWGKLLESAKESKSTKGFLEEFITSRSKLTDLFEREVVKQRRRVRRVKSARGKINMFSWATGGLGTIATIAELADPLLAVIGVSTGALGFVTGELFGDAIERRMPGTELVLLASRISH